MQVIYCGCFCLSQCRFSLFCVTFRLLSSVSSIAALNIIHLLATLTERSIVHALLFFPYFELLPLATLLFFHTISVQKSILEFSSLSWSCKNVKFPFSPEKLCSVTVSHSPSLLSVSLILLSCVYNPYFPSSCGGPHTRSHSMWPGVPKTQSWSLSHFLLNEIITGMSSFPPPNQGACIQLWSTTANISGCHEILHFYFSLTHFYISLCCHSDVLINLVLSRMCPSLGREASCFLFVAAQWDTSFHFCALCQAHTEAPAP